VERIDRHSGDVATFHLAWTGPRLRFRPGQFVHVALDAYDASHHWPESRVFSIASAPSDPRGMRLTISRQGRFSSRLLDEVGCGRTLWCKGPYGEFEVRAGDPDAPVVLVAGGTGVTPFCAFMEEAIIRPDTAVAPVRLYYGARTADLLPYARLAERCAAVLPRFEAWLFAEEGTLPAGVARGRLDIHRIAGAATGDLSTRFYLSGPPSMIAMFATYLRDVRGVPPERVLVDAWE
jgi:ferredoxin-NADP reductase